MWAFILSQMQHNGQTAPRKRQRDSDTDSTNSETDETDSEHTGSSDSETDETDSECTGSSDSYAESTDSDSSNEKPVAAKRKGSSQKTIGKKSTRATCNKTSSRKENRVKGASKETITKVPKRDARKARNRTNNRLKAKQGVPGIDELEGLARDIGDQWTILGRRLKVTEELESIDSRHKNLYEKAYQMLKYWKQKRGSSATYRVLSTALKDELVQRKDLSEKYCYG